MIKVYLDWSVMSQMKNGKHPSLLEIIKNQDKFLLFYSTAHIGDIYSSMSDDEKQKKRIQEDLDFITSLTKDFCLFTSGYKVLAEYYGPAELMKQRVDDKDLLSGSILDNIQKTLSENEFSKGMGTAAVEMIKAIPMGSILKDTLDDPEKAAQLDKVFPGLGDNPTMEGFFASFGEMIKNLNDQDGYNNLREITQKGFDINPDKISNSLNPFEIIAKAHDKSAVSLDNYLNTSKSGPKWFNEISNEYVLLDMHGYHQDKVNIKKGRKETFRNTTEDSFHTAFASTCDFYITNDNKNFPKANQVYRKLNINTLVMKPEEFLEYYNTCLNIDDLINTLNLVIAIAKSKYFVEKETENGFIRTYYCPFFLFNYFNKMYLLDDSDSLSYVLAREKPTNGNTYWMEVNKLVSHLNSQLGNDIDNIGEADYNEFETEEWIGRKWTIHGISFHLKSVNKFIQLYIDFNIKP